MQLSVRPDLKIDAKKFFSLVKKKRYENIGVSSFHEYTSLKFTKADRARILNNKFSSVFSVNDKASPNVQGHKSGTIHDINITKEGITKLLKNLQSFIKYLRLTLIFM